MRQIEEWNFKQPVYKYEVTVAFYFDGRISHCNLFACILFIFCTIILVNLFPLYPMHLNYFAPQIGE